MRPWQIRTRVRRPTCRRNRCRIFLLRHRILIRIARPKIRTILRPRSSSAFSVRGQCRPRIAVIRPAAAAPATSCRGPVKCCKDIEQIPTSNWAISIPNRPLSPKVQPRYAPPNPSFHRFQGQARRTPSRQEPPARQAGQTPQPFRISQGGRILHRPSHRCAAPPIHPCRVRSDRFAALPHLGPRGVVDGPSGRPQVR